MIDATAIATRSLIAGACSLALGLAADAYAVQVLPAGQDAAIEAMLGGADPLAGCVRTTAQVERARLFATWQCPTGVASATLVHASTAPAGATIAGTWAISATGAPADFTAALEARVRQSGAEVRWQEVEAEVAPADPATPVAAAAKGDSPYPPVAPMSAEAKKILVDSEVLRRAGRAHELLPQLEALLRQETHSLLLAGMVVAAVSRVSQPDGIAWTDERMAAADRTPDDALAQFIAGVAVHYRGHGRGETVAAKRADYERALHHLERVKSVYARSPRVWIYLAVSYLRTGRQAEAEAAIARAVEFDDGGDADIFYCRAEVWHRKDPKRALADIERYQATMRRNVEGGGFSAPEKETRVEAMRLAVAAVAAGKGTYGDVDLFDPVELHVTGNDPLVAPPWLAAGVACVVGAGVLWWRRRKVLNDKAKP